MSTPQRTHARVILVARETADVLRLQAKKVMDLGHELFEDFLLYGPEAQYALATRFCDATALITAVGWDPNNVDANATTFEVPLTDDLIEQLHHRRSDLAFTNKDRLDGLDVNEPISPDLLAEDHHRPTGGPGARPPLRRLHQSCQGLTSSTNGRRELNPRRPAFGYDVSRSARSHG